MDATPTLTFEDTTTGDATDDWRIRVDGGAIYFESGTAFTSRLQSDGSFVYAVSGLAAGSTDSAHVLKWSRHSSTLSATGVTTIPLPYSQKVLGVTCMVETTASGTQYDVHSWWYAPTAGSQRFTVQVTRSSGGDTVVITDTSDSGDYDDHVYRIVAFHEP